jgi:iron complex transport system substrate-binding protein
MRFRTAITALALVLAACARSAPVPQAETPQSGLRIVPTTTAAAELLTLVAGPEDVLALPEQVDAWSAHDFKSGGWEKLARFPHFVAEPLLVLRPGLVVCHRWQVGSTNEILERNHIPVLTLESGTSYEELRSTLQSLGHALQRDERARQALALLDARVAALAGRRAPFAAVRALIYTNDGVGGWAAGAHTTSDTILKLAGLANAAASAGVEGHAQLGFERLLALDPDLIVTGLRARGESGSTTRSVIDSTATLATLRARREQRYVELPAELLSSDSQYIVDAAEKLQAEAARVLALPR